MSWRKALSSTADKNLEKLLDRFHAIMMTSTSMNVVEKSSFDQQRRNHAVEGDGGVRGGVNLIYLPIASCLSPGVF